MRDDVKLALQLRRVFALHSLADPPQAERRKRRFLARVGPVGGANLLNLQRMNSECYLYKLYAERVAENRRNPVPAGWDGVTAFDEK